eukprot:CAMPEP_0205822662 /NCGR_PEP_ID=MMETSP0206-20130828/13467_1 /ASSEMBLY_ACC=CAM_ASM_000279 /TAXON_ID=36767 /ORGANISM="Euplotes focardii, Strain TN1" /LENGTH=68 /DNA_ID=CAMNT_0053119117 /DNA_START=450 /DNA_END=656 /DNA_ORIENTATION=+
MHWGSATEDVLSFHEVKVPNLKAAIDLAKRNGHGYDVQMPQHRYHKRQAYIDNFGWKGEPVAEEVDDE